MKVENLRSLIRESINDYIRGIDEAGNKAALDAKITATQEAIELRKKKMNMDGLDEAYHDMLDKGKVKELGGEVKALERNLTKLQKQLSKLTLKSEPKAEVVSDGELPADEASVEKLDITSEIELEEARSKKVKDAKKVVKKDEEVLNESFIKMQKLAGVITEAQYNQKKRLIEGEDDGFNLRAAYDASPDTQSYEDMLDVVKGYEGPDFNAAESFKEFFSPGKPVTKDAWEEWSRTLDGGYDPEGYVYLNWVSLTDPDIYKKAGI